MDSEKEEALDNLEHQLDGCIYVEHEGEDVIRYDFEDETSIWFYKNTSQLSGCSNKSKFFKRLVKELKKIGIEATHAGEF